MSVSRWRLKVEYDWLHFLFILKESITSETMCCRKRSMNWMPTNQPIWLKRWAITFCWIWCRWNNGQEVVLLQVLVCLRTPNIRCWCTVDVNMFSWNIRRLKVRFRCRLVAVLLWAFRVAEMSRELNGTYPRQTVEIMFFRFQLQTCIDRSGKIVWIVSIRQCSHATFTQRRWLHSPNQFDGE